MVKYCLAAAAVAFLSAAPIAAKPTNAADVERGDGCIVTDANGLQEIDPTCRAMATSKRDADGNLISYNYHDQGMLQPGQTAPSSAVRYPVEFTTSNGLSCTGQEVIKPSGEYSSTAQCR